MNSVFNLFSRLVSLVGASTPIWVSILLVLVTVVEVARYELDRARTEYAFNVVMFNLRGAGTPAEIKELVALWKKDEWGAQIGAIQTLCVYGKERLLTIGSTELVTDLCRIAK